MVASFNDSHNFYPASSSLRESNGRALLVVGDAGNLDISGLAMNNKRDAATNLWAAAPRSQSTIRVRGATLNYAMVDDFVVWTNTSN